MVSNLEDIRAAAGTSVRTYIDDTTPPDHFIASAVFLGMLVVYLLAGPGDDPQARIVGRIEYGVDANAYAGSGLKGGRLLFGAHDSRSAFQAMINVAAADRWES